ncbi:integrase [Protofrankia coriariae]|uniref:Integrase n=1 Tax=Protofrankia coriariae TaxID=1562887 RepID=A0ABR5EYY5_9ACTN|nr:integrase [Protofrankia coriariae]
MSDNCDRVIDLIDLPEWGRVVPMVGVEPFCVVDEADRPVEPVRRFLRDLVAQGCSAATIRSYAFALLRWWRFLRAVEVEWSKACPAEARDFVLWLQRTSKRRRLPRTDSAMTAGTVNPITRKRFQDDSYMVATIRHSNAVVRSFYVFWIERGEGPLVNPVVLARGRGRRPHAHHNPSESFRPEGRLRYNPPAPKRRPRAMPDELWEQLFTAMRSDRDRAILALAVSTGARAGELLGMRGVDLDWGDQLIQVRRKGTRAPQWLPASPEAFVWLRLHVEEIGGVGADAPVWQTLRRRARDGGLPGRVPLNYEALRAVLRRANGLLGTNWTMHDLRHTCALRMIRDARLSLRDVQTILGHAHLTTTETYLVEDDLEVIRRVRDYLAGRDEPLTLPGDATTPYRAEDLTVLFGPAGR